MTKLYELNGPIVMINSCLLKYEQYTTILDFACI